MLVKTKRGKIISIAIGLSVSMMIFLIVNHHQSADTSVPRVYAMPKRTSDVSLKTGRIYSPSEAYSKTKAGQPAPEVVESTVTSDATVEACCDEEEEIYAGLESVDKTSEEYQEELRLIKKKRELTARLIELGEREVELSNLLIESVDNELSAMYSLFALMSPLELKIAKQQALAVLPSDEVEDFFNDVENAETRTLDEIDAIAQGILSFREFHDMMDEQLSLEFEELKRQFAEVGITGGVN